MAMSIIKKNIPDHFVDIGHKVTWPARLVIAISKISNKPLRKRLPVNYVLISNTELIQTMCDLKTQELPGQSRSEVMMAE